MQQRTTYLVNISGKTITLHFPVGIGHIARSLVLGKFPFKIVDLIPVSLEKREEVFAQILRSISHPSIFGFSIIAGNGHVIEVEKYARMVKESNPEHIIVFGGPLPSAIPNLCLDKSIADYVVTGEGEESFLGFIKNLPEKNFADVPGLAYKDSRGMVMVNKSSRIKDLDRYSPIPYELFDMEFYNGYLKSTGRCFEISGSRGCKGACKFCFRFSGPGLTTRSGKSIFEEVRFIYEKYGIDKFNFTDENFLEQRNSFNSFLSLLKDENINIKFRGQTRVDEIDGEFCETLAKSGLISINFGVESADDEILSKISKGISIKDVESKIDLIRSFGIEVYTSVIIGFPWDTKKSIMTMKDFIVRNKLAGRCTVNYLSPLPGTWMFEEAKRRKLIGDEWSHIRNMGYLYQDRTVNMTLLDGDEIGRYYLELLALGEPSTTKASRKYSGILIDSSIEAV